jgi:hypothetical protein
MDVEEAIDFFNISGFVIRISEGKFSPYLQDSWVATATISSIENEIITHGLSFGGGNRQRARCFAIFEALERLYFRAFVNPSKICASMKNSSLTFQHIFGLGLCSYFQFKNGNFSPINALSLNKSSSAKPASSNGWALGKDAWDACQRASNELIERDVLKNIEKYSSLIAPISIENFELGHALTQIAQDLNLQFNTFIVPLSSSKLFALSCMYDQEKNKTFLGTAVGDFDQDAIINKSLEEVALGYYFAIVAGDEKIGLPADDFNYLSFTELYNSLNRPQIPPPLPKIENNIDLLPFSLISNFTFRVFPVHNNDGAPKLFVAQATTEVEKVDVGTRFK